MVQPKSVAGLASALIHTGTTSTDAKLLGVSGLVVCCKHIPYFDYNSALISVLVEQWCSETHTFHLPYGKCTVMLQDVAFQLGLRVDGEPVNGCTSNWETHLNHDIWSFYKELLGVVPEESDMQGCTIKLT